MSDTPPQYGAGWWQASDGKWYPPRDHPDYRPPPPPHRSHGDHPAPPAPDSDPAALTSTSRRWAVLFGALGVVAALVFAAAWWEDRQRSAGTSDAVDDLMVGASTWVDVEYCWSGSAGPVDITMTNAYGNVQQADDRENNQCIDVGRLRRGEYVSISAQRAGGGSGVMRCRIAADGETIESASSDGEFVIASCRGRVR